MARIPIYQTNWQTLKQIFPVPQTGTLDPAGKVQGFALNITSDVYLDVNTIIYVQEYFDLGTFVLRDARIIGLEGMAAIVVEESYDTIKALMTKDCTTLCTDA
jgi:hypothetical protein